MAATLTLDRAEQSARQQLSALVACIGGFIALALGAWLAMPLSPVSQERYLAAAQDHVAMLADSKGEKGRIVLLGGSGTAFSISSEDLTRDLGRPVYNGGIQATIGLRNLIDLYRPHLDPQNDTIVLLPEPEMLALDARYSQTWCDVLFLSKDVSGLVQRPRCVPQVMLRTWQDARHHASGARDVDPVYRRSGFNARGDLTSHLGYDKPAPDFSEYTLPDASPAQIENIVDYARQQLAAEGFTMIYIPAAMPRRACTASREALDAMAKRLERLNTGERSAHELSQSCLPHDLFFDGAGHLNREGRSIWTQRVRAALAQSLPS